MKKNNYTYYLIFLFAAFTAVRAQNDTLSIDRCIQIALKNNPQIKIAESNLDLAEANLTSVRSTIFPQVALNSGWNRNGGNFFQGPKAIESTFENYSVGFQLNQQIFDFGHTYTRISGTAELKHSSEQDLVTARQSLILNTYISYFTYLQAIRIKEASLESLQQSQQHLLQAQSFYNVGTKPQFDVLKAQTDLANAKVNLITAENNIVLSRLQLENVLNTRLGEGIKLKDNLGIRKDTVDLQNALKTAWDNRPEFIGAKLKVDASRDFVYSAWTFNLPTINLTGGYNWKTFSLSQNFLDSWNLGVTISLPLFQGFALQAGIDQANANLKFSEANFDFVQQSINLDVQQQYSNMKLSIAKIEATKSLLDQAQETLKLAEGRYSQGIGSPLEITDARVTYLNSELIYIQALYDYQVAFVKLYKAMGTLK